VIYEKQKVLVRSQVASEIQILFENKSIILDSITEKLMAIDFNRTFNRGEGQTTSSRAKQIVHLGHKSRIKALIKGIGISAYAIKQLALFRNDSEPIGSIGWVYGIPQQYLASFDAVKDLGTFLDVTLNEQNMVTPTKYFVQNGSLENRFESERIEVVSHIGAKILSLGNESRITTILQIIKRMLFWLRISIKHPIFLLIGPEYIVDILAIEQRREQKKDLFITSQTQLLAPALVFKSSNDARRIMYWYSNNSTQISKRSREELDYSYLNQPQISSHFVWTSSWGEILKEKNFQSQVSHIGPIIFRDLSVLKRSAGLKSETLKTVTVFDVTPKKTAGSNAYYTEIVMIKFIEDIYQTINSKFPNALVRLKPKREYTYEDSLRYQNFLAERSSDIKLLEWDSNIIDEILKSDLVICIPYSSPALISKHLGVPAVFYSPSSEFNLEKNHENISVIQGLNELQLFLTNFGSK
jgi:polysaccharide biosynthesis PFTS motif protein